MLQHNINEEEIKQTAEQIKELLPATDENKQLIKKALITYRQGSISALSNFNCWKSLSSSFSK